MGVHETRRLNGSGPGQSGGGGGNGVGWDHRTRVQSRNASGHANGRSSPSARIPTSSHSVAMISIVTSIINRLSHESRNLQSADAA